MKLINDQNEKTMKTYVIPATEVVNAELAGSFTAVNNSGIDQQTKYIEWEIANDEEDEPSGFGW